MSLFLPSIFSYSHLQAVFPTLVLVFAALPIPALISPAEFVSASALQVLFPSMPSAELSVFPIQPVFPVLLAESFFAFLLLPAL